MSKKKKKQRKQPEFPDEYKAARDTSTISALAVPVLMAALGFYAKYIGRFDVFSVVAFSLLSLIVMWNFHRVFHRLQQQNEMLWGFANFVDRKLQKLETGSQTELKALISLMDSTDEIKTFSPLKTADKPEPFDWSRWTKEANAAIDKLGSAEDDDAGGEVTPPAKRVRRRKPKPETDEPPPRFDENDRRIIPPRKL